MESASPLTPRARPKRRRIDRTTSSDGSEEAAAGDAASTPPRRRPPTSSSATPPSEPAPREVHYRDVQGIRVPILERHTWAKKKELMLAWLRTQQTDGGAPAIDARSDYAAVKEAFDERVGALRPVRYRADGVPILDRHTWAKKKELMLAWLRTQQTDDGAPAIDDARSDYAAVKEAFDERVGALRPVRYRADGVPILERHTRQMKRRLMVEWLRTQRTDDGAPLIPDGDVTFASTPSGDIVIFATPDGDYSYKVVKW